MDTKAVSLMPSKPLTIALVSGKGGVGKTVLASDLAWVWSRVARTVLVDLDFQNQGLKGLFAPHVEFSRSSALDAIEKPENADLQKPVEVAEGLGFLPSVSWLRETSQDEIAQCANATDFPERLSALIQSLHENQAFKIVILDCHGGVDAVSLGAFQICEHTLMVTEADSVAFNGTLELLHYYETKTRGLLPASVDDPSGQSTGRNVRLVVNRLSSKYRWKDLERIYKRVMEKSLGTFSSDRSVFCYIPVEESLADTIGEHPFYVALAPNSIFAKKVHYMVYSLAEGRVELPSHYNPLVKFQKPSYRKKVERVVVSYEHKNTQAILKSFAWLSTLYTLALIVLAGGWIHDVLFSSHTPAWQEAMGYTTALFILAVVLLAPILWYPLRAIFGLMFLYRDKHRFQKALFRSISPKLTLWQRLTLAKLFILRIGTSIIPFFMGAYAIFLALFLFYSLVVFLLA